MNYLLCSWGSGGDLIPFLSLGAALRRRGHGATLLGNPEWRARAEAAGLRFVPAFAAAPPLDPGAFSTRLAGLASFRTLFEKTILPLLDEMTEAVLREAPAHDAVVAHHFAFPAALGAEALDKPWACVALAPGVTPSAEGLPAAFPFAGLPGPLGRLFSRMVWGIGRQTIAPFVDRPLNALRGRLGLPPARDHMFSPRAAQRILHLYSPHFAPRPADWDARHAVTGFCFDPAPPAPLPPEVEAFLDAGPEPWLFTLGTAVVGRPGNFYRAAAAALEGTERRALLLVGDSDPGPLPENVLAWPALPLADLLPRCAAAAHHAGIGTLAAALRAGLPALACPVAFDQPNNAARLQKLGAGRLLHAARRTAQGFRWEMGRLASGAYADRAEDLADRLEEEDGPGNACVALEQL
ncbi:MAG: glycosyltransferase [Verrucomicrobium sp.]|nr:glycosyltransferase [Verrucomicrobium sp.]